MRGGLQCRGITLHKSHRFHIRPKDSVLAVFAIGPSRFSVPSCSALLHDVQRTTVPIMSHQSESEDWATVASHEHHHHKRLCVALQGRLQTSSW